MRASLKDLSATPIDPQKLETGGVAPDQLNRVIDELRLETEDILEAYETFQINFKLCCEAADSAPETFLNLAEEYEKSAACFFPLRWRNTARIDAGNVLSVKLADD